MRHRQCGHCRPGRTGHAGGRGRQTRTPVQPTRPRVRRRRPAGRLRPGRSGHRVERLANQCPCVQRPRHRDGRCRPRSRWRSSACCPRRTLEQRSGRGPDQPARAAEAANLRLGQLRPAAPPRSDGGMIHANYERTTNPREHHPNLSLPSHQQCYRRVRPPSTTRLCPVT